MLLFENRGEEMITAWEFLISLSLLIIGTFAIIAYVKSRTAEVRSLTAQDRCKHLEQGYSHITHDLIGELKKR